MDLRPKIQLDAMIKAMSEVVLPAVDPNNQLACEQAQLVLGMLHLMASRMPWQFHYDVDALDRALELADFIVENGDGGNITHNAVSELKQTTSAGKEVREGARVSPAKLEEMLLALRNQTANVVEAIWADGNPERRDVIARAVLDAASEQNARERAWFAPQAWDSPAEAPAPLETLIKTAPGNESIND